jgi:hypothetical protein
MKIFSPQPRTQKPLLARLVEAAAIDPQQFVFCRQWDDVLVFPVM